MTASMVYSIPKVIHCIVNEPTSFYETPLPTRERLPTSIMTKPVTSLHKWHFCDIKRRYSKSARADTIGVILGPTDKSSQFFKTVPMEGEEEICEVPPSLYQDFPNIDEGALGCLTPWPTGEEYCGSLYGDLYGQASKDPLVPSPISPDPFLREVSEIRTNLAHISLFRFNGVCEENPVASQIFTNSMFKFSSIYPNFAATMIQRFWKAKRKGATKSDKFKFALAMIVRPRNAASPEERKIRALTVSELLQACPPELTFS